MAAFSVRPVPIAMVMESGRTSQRSISAAPASATPIVVESLAGSEGTTSTRSRAKRDLRRAPKSMQRPMGWSRRTFIRPSLTESETRRCADWREMPSLVAISSWVLPAT
ncbi:hypothetical protein D3C87_1668190 [compost metagenome]